MSTASPSKTGFEDGESRLSKGQASRATILLTAARLATTKGLAGLSIGDLAAAVGMSKSGIYAHFKSKEDLELATIETAAAILAEEVLQPAMRTRPGLERLEVMMESYIQHLERKTYPNGCFFAAVSLEMDSRPGPARDRIVEVMNSWLALIQQCLVDAQTAGTLDSDVQVAQTTFELEGMVLAGNFVFAMTDDPVHLERARTGIKNILERVTATTKDSLKQLKA